MTYATLQTEISNNAHRSDLTSVIPTFIENAEMFLFREVAPVEIEAEATGTITSNSISFPTGFVSVQKLEVSTPVGYITLDYKNGNESETETTQYPLYYTVDKGRIRILANVANGTAYRLQYSLKLTALSVSNTTNWLLDNAKDLYLAASMVELGKYIRNTELIATWQATIPALLESVKSFSQRKKFPARGSLQIKPRR